MFLGLVGSLSCLEVSDGLYVGAKLECREAAENVGVLTKAGGNIAVGVEA